MWGQTLNEHLSEVSGGTHRMTHQNYMSWMGACVCCGKIRRAGHGLFCSNYLLGRAPFQPCRNVWCGKCYKEAINDPFPRLDQKGVGNESDLMGLDDDHTLSWYRCGRDGDHLMGEPFECDLCSFRNVLSRDPEFGNRKDLFTLTDKAGLIGCDVGARARHSRRQLGKGQG